MIAWLRGSQARPGRGNLVARSPRLRVVDRCCQRVMCLGQIPSRAAWLAAVAVTATVLAAAMPAPAVTATGGSAWYRASRQSLTLLFRIEGHRVALVWGSYREHCSSGRPHRGFIDNAQFNRRINQNGRFRWRTLAEADTFTFFQKGHGTVHPNALTGQFFVQFTQSGSVDKRCWTGRSFNNPWTRFVARRLGGPPQSGRG